MTQTDTDLEKASDPTTPAEALARLGLASSPAAVREALAANPSTPLPVLLWLARGFSQSFVANPALSLHCLAEPLALAGLGEDTTRLLLGMSTTPGWLCAALLSSLRLPQDHWLRLCLDPTTTPEALRAWASQAEPSLRCAVAHRRGLTENARELFASDPDPLVRAALALAADDRAWAARLAADEHPATRLAARCEGKLAARGWPEAVGVSDAGRHRDHNEDAMWMGALGEARLAVVADGMGGHHTGRVAADATIEGLPEAMARLLQAARDDELAVSLELAIEAAHWSVVKLTALERHNMGCGSTVVALLLRGRHAFVGHVGDSRLYRLRGGRIEALTRDHSLVNDHEEMTRESGIKLTPEQIEQLPKNVLTRALGISMKHAGAVVRSIDVAPGDRLLLCSDGLNGALNDARIAEIWRKNDRGKAVQPLVEAAMDAGGQDNITVVETWV